MYLFDFEIQHVQATRHVAPDGLSRRPHADDDTDNTDEDLEPDESGHFMTGMRPSDQFDIEFELSNEEEIAISSVCLHQTSGEQYDIVANRHSLGAAIFRPDDHSTLWISNVVDPRVIRGQKRELPNDLPIESNDSSSSDESEANPLPSKLDRQQFKTHKHKVMDEDGDQYWNDIIFYLNTFKIPEHITNRKSFREKTKRYFMYDDRLWKRSTRQWPPVLVMLDTSKRQELIAKAHDDLGHRGRDPTYKKLSDTYFWPNMVTEIAIFCRTCMPCQMRSAYRPKILLKPTHVPTILRKMNIDIVQMGIKSTEGYEYIVDMRDDLMGWIEARMLKTKESQVVADFVFQDAICRFGCIPQITADNGKEFEGAFAILTRKYGIPIVKTSPYHPEGNGMIERGHRTWITSIWKLCRNRPQRWPQYFYAALWADQVTTRRATGFSPYYLLYGKPHFFPFHIDDRSWYILDWHKVRTTKELLLMRTKQFAGLKEDRKWSAKVNAKTRIRAAEDHARRNARRLVKGHYDPGTLVVVYQAQFDVSTKFQGAKYKERWAGPYRVIACLLVVLID
jgi:hypothetical protein